MLRTCLVGREVAKKKKNTRPNLEMVSMEEELLLLQLLLLLALLETESRLIRH
jgi:hypothetical protein